MNFSASSIHKGGMAQPQTRWHETQTNQNPKLDLLERFYMWASPRATNAHIGKKTVPKLGNNL
jgi:hypothetical protein